VFIIHVDDNHNHQPYYYSKAYRAFSFVLANKPYQKGYQRDYENYPENIRGSVHGCKGSFLVCKSKSFNIVIKVASLPMALHLAQQIRL